jgi:hypothetical protein
LWACRTCSLVFCVPAKTVGVVCGWVFYFAFNLNCTIFQGQVRVYAAEHQKADN